MERQRILVVEDDRTTRDLMRAIFAHLGWEVALASTVAEGLALLESRPDCLVLDFTLPDGNGAEILQGVRRAGLPTRVAVVSGWTDLNILEKLKPEVVLCKPICPDELIR